MSRSRLEQLVVVGCAVGTAILPLRAGADAVPFGSASTIDVAAGATWLRAADLDRDGDLDLIGNLERSVWWYERDPAVAGGYVEHEVYAYPASTTIHEIEIGDVDDDGWVDVLVYREVVNLPGSSLILDWLENDGGPAAGLWTKRNIKTWGDDVFIHSQTPDSLEVADFDGDGDLDVTVGREILPETGWEGQIEWIGNDGTPVDGGWNGHILRDWEANKRLYSLRAGDLDGDGDLDLVGTPEEYPAMRPVVWWENDGTPANGAWAEHMIESSLAHSFACRDDIDLGDIDRDGDLDVAMGMGLNLFWWENDGTPAVGEWASHAIPASATGACSVRLADVDRDGDLDAMTDEPGVGWYENDGTPRVGSWTFRAIEDVGCDEVLVADLDGDGDPDVAGSDSESFFSFENLEIHRSVKLLDETAVNNLVDEAYDLLAVDLDRDGDVDLVSAAEASDRLYWHHNDGTPGPGTWTLSAISTLPDGPRAVAASDLDGDGDTDLVSASYNDDTVAWYENTGANGDWTRRVISNAAGGAQDVVVVDIDGDGDLDVAAAQYLDNEISWYRNNGASPPGFGGFFVDSTPFVGPRALAAGDLDGDGDVDLAAVSETGDAAVRYTNDGTPDVDEWDLHPIDEFDVDGPKDIALVDLDRDGDLDAVVAADAGGAVSWYENEGSPIGWTGRTINGNCGRARSVAPGDYDGDGDPDVLLSCYDDDAIWLARNNGGATPGFINDLVSVSANGARTVVAADLDRDGHLDGAVAQGSDDQIAWYENVGGQFRVTGTAIATNPLANDQPQGAFRAVVLHRGRVADESVELSAVAVKLEATAGDPLTAFEAASLVDAVQVYGDDGDNVFESWADPLLASGAAAGIDVQGVVWVDLLDGIAGAAIPAVTQKTYFVALELANPYGAFAPPSLRVTLLTDGANRCEAQDRAFDLPLDLEPTTSVATSTVTFVDALFRDGFESGDTVRWDGTRP